MTGISATCLAIANALRNGTLGLVPRQGRFGTYISIEDDKGIIEVAEDPEEAQARIREVMIKFNLRDLEEEAELFFFEIGQEI